MKKLFIPLAIALFINFGAYSQWYSLFPSFYAIEKACEKNQGRWDRQVRMLLGEEGITSESLKLIHIPTIYFKGNHRKIVESLVFIEGQKSNFLYSLTRPKVSHLAKSFIFADNGLWVAHDYLKKLELGGAAAYDQKLAAELAALDPDFVFTINGIPAYWMIKGSNVKILLIEYAGNPHSIEFRASVHEWNEYVDTLSLTELSMALDKPMRILVF